jgi:hypothetical protein
MFTQAFLYLDQLKKLIDFNRIIVALCKYYNYVGLSEFINNNLLNKNITSY